MHVKDLLKFFIDIFPFEILVIQPYYKYNKTVLNFAVRLFVPENYTFIKLLFESIRVRMEIHLNMSWFMRDSQFKIKLSQKGKKYNIFKKIMTKGYKCINKKVT